jgi:hypothetical protein
MLPFKLGEITYKKEVKNTYFSYIATKLATVANNNIESYGTNKVGQDKITLPYTTDTERTEHCYKHK